MVLGVTGSIWGGTGWYLVVLGQLRPVLVGTRSVEGGTRSV